MEDILINRVLTNNAAVRRDEEADYDMEFSDCKSSGPEYQR